MASKGAWFARTGWLLALGVVLAAPSRAQDDVDPAAVKALVARCGQGIEWCDSWDSARARARASSRPILVLFRTLAGLDVPDAALSGPFMDPDVVELVRERYVALRHQKGMDAPFVSDQVYGLGPLAFGTSVLVVTEEGAVLADTACLDSIALYQLLAGTVGEAESGPETSAEPSEPHARREAASRALRRGELDRARALLADARDAEGSLLCATLERRCRNATASLAALERAKAAGVPAADVACDESTLRASLESPERGLEVLDSIPADHRDAARALYLRANLHFLLGEVERGRAELAELVRAHQDDESASLAAVLLSYGPLLERLAGTPLGGPSAEILGVLERSPYQRTTWPALRPAMREAREHLLATQCSDGSWPVGFSVTYRGRSERFPLAVAVTALSARALLADLDQPPVRAAFDRAMEFLARARRATREEGDPFGIMDYSVWSKPTLLLLIRDALAADAVDSDSWTEELEVLVEELLRKQKTGGGFSYYQGASVGSLDPTLDVSFSFVTAYVLLGLHAAQEAGAEVDPGALDRALTCLERSYDPDGSTQYGLMPGSENAPRTPTPAGSAGRGPLCALALAAYGRAREPEVRAALDRFLVHRASYAHEQGKTVMHCGPEGQGCHYLLFDYLYAAEAVASLRPRERRAYEDAVLDQIRGARLENGAYLDTPILGDRYGAAMGLLALQRLDRGGR